MKVPHSWLLELLPGLPPAGELEPALAHLGIPVEEVLEVPAPPEGVVFAVVRSADLIEGTGLKRLELDLGDHTVTAVSGAENARVGIGVALALPGARLPASQEVDTDGLGVVVGKRVVAGVESYGFACSPRELGLGDYGGGLLELPAGEAAPGTPLAELWAADEVLDLEVTPNRSDALSVLGVARDLAASLGLELREPSRGLPSRPDPEFPVKVELDPRRDCDRFVARMARGVTVGPSPAWLQRRLTLAGMRPINTLVDASNYVMLELGQPTAAYDAADLPTLGIVVRDGAEGEVLLGLNGEEYAPSPADLVVSTPVDGALRPIGVGGVLGARYSAITENTRDVILEAAHWDPVRLRLTARRLGLSTDAAYRFERGVDPNLPAWAADRYMELVAAIAGGEVFPGRRDVGEERQKLEIEFRPGYANSLLGTSFEDEAMREALERLGCEVALGSGGSSAVPLPPLRGEVGRGGAVRDSGKGDGTQGSELRGPRNAIGAVPSNGYSDRTPHPNPPLQGGRELWTVRPPTYRLDLLIEEDLVEEVARVLGYDAIPETLPTSAMGEDNRGLDAAVRAKRGLKDVFAGLGFQEVVTYTFTSPTEAERSRANSPRLLLANPQSSERTGLRTALYPSLLGAARVNRGAGSLLLFEVGRVFPEPALEEERLGLLLAGPYAPAGWSVGVGGGFYALKGLLEAAAARFGDKLEVRPAAEPPSHLHPGAAGEVVWNGYNVGEIGLLHPAVAAELELFGDAAVAELQLPLPGRPWSFIDPSRLPAARRDLAVVAPRARPYAEIAGLAREAAGLLLESVEPFDVYSGPPVPEGSRSVAVRLSFRAPGRTLTDAEVDAAMSDVMAAVRRAGLEVRE